MNNAELDSTWVELPDASKSTTHQPWTWSWFWVEDLNLTEHFESKWMIDRCSLSVNTPVSSKKEQTGPWLRFWKNKNRKGNVYNSPCCLLSNYFWSSISREKKDPKTFGNEANSEIGLVAVCRKGNPGHYKQLHVKMSLFTGPTSKPHVPVLQGFLGFFFLYRSREIPPANQQG